MCVGHVARTQWLALRLWDPFGAGYKLSSIILPELGGLLGKGFLSVLVT